MEPKQFKILLISILKMLKKIKIVFFVLLQSNSFNLHKRLLSN
jgi:hypothetical protein